MEGPVVTGERPTTRRSVLRAVALAGTAAIAGCFSDDGGSTTTSPSHPQSPPNSDVQETNVDGGDLVVRLRDGHAVSQLNLIGPDGSLFAETEVATGATSVRIQLLDIQPGIGGYEHYTPGQYELVAVQDGTSETLPLELEPDLRATEVTQFRDGPKPSDLGKLALTIENVGTGPTWVYDITYEGAPNSSSNDSVHSDAGIIDLNRPESPNECLLDPGSGQAFVGATAPLLLTDNTNQSCQGTHQFTVVVGTPVGDPLDCEVEATVGGEVRSAGLTGQFTCADVGVELKENGDSSD